VMLARHLFAETLGIAILVATVVGSGIMAERLAGGNEAIALLGNTLPTGAILVVLVSIFTPVSGAHFNPAVTLVFAARAEFPRREVLPYIAAHNQTLAREAHGPLPAGPGPGWARPCPAVLGASPCCTGGGKPWPPDLGPFLPAGRPGRAYSCVRKGLFLREQHTGRDCCNSRTD
jgi:hypothetical protein